MKRLICLLLSLILCLSVPSVAFADILLPEEETDLVVTTAPSSDSTRAEETIWYFRTVNGIVQMRLWSLTYRKWLTDWIDIGPAP